ncbi:MAG: hypothetical protein PHD37_02310 [Gallionellaceae bacterium]|nr:hypothetical protein [Gallionellaceae bacterium]
MPRSSRSSKAALQVVAADWLAGGHALVCQGGAFDVEALDANKHSGAVRHRFRRPGFGREGDARRLRGGFRLPHAIEQAAGMGCGGQRRGCEDQADQAEPGKQVT